MSDPRETEKQPVCAPRRPTRQISVGGVTLGGDAPVRVQSMTTTKTGDHEATIQQTQLAIRTLLMDLATSGSVVGESLSRGGQSHSLGRTLFALQFRELNRAQALQGACGPHIESSCLHRGRWNY